MGIYAPHVEMPEKCVSCKMPCKLWDYHADRPKDCPLIPVTDHGRLVDADALFGCEYGEPRTNTNYDRFIRKTPEELAEFFAQQGYKKPVFYDEWLPLCNYVMGAKICHENGCKDCWLDWLLSPAKEGEI